jgi:Cu(I)/Ag(I) efflux system periplasmic protein CusF
MKAIAWAALLALGTVFVSHAAETKHWAVGVVKKVDPKAGTVTLAHEPVKSIKWPSMTMAFQVKDKALLEKLPEGRKVEFEFEERGRDYVVTNVK